MNTNIETNNLDKYSNVLLNQVKNYFDYKNSQTESYIFKSTQNSFESTLREENKEELKGFRILTKLERFFYSYKDLQTNTTNTAITNVILNKNEKLSFYKNKEKVEINGKKEFSYDELIKLSKNIQDLNKKIIIIGILEGKLTKIEASYTSEIPLYDYIDMYGLETKTDMKGEQRFTKDNKEYNVLSFSPSQDREIISNEEINKSLLKLDEEINSINNHLSNEEINVEDFDFTNI